MITVHGGDLEAVAQAYGVDARSLIDFSANIAPHGPPAGVAGVLRSAAAATRTLSPYPSPGYDALRAAIASKENVAPAQVVVGQGASGLIDAAVREARAPVWIVPVPAFGDYRRAIESAGSRMIGHPLERNLDLDAEAFVLRVAETPGAGVLLNTPHNPSGRTWEAPALRAILDACVRLGRPFLLDEAFVDYDPEQSFLRETLEYERGIVIRSLTKFYALAGVRVGFALVAEARATSLRTAMPSWPVGTLDAAIAIEALADEAYARRTREQNAIERDRLFDSLCGLGLGVERSAANFLLVDLRRPPGVMDEILRGLAVQGIAVRDCRSFEGLVHRTFIRTAVLARPENERLVDALATVLASAREPR